MAAVVKTEVKTEVAAVATVKQEIQPLIPPGPQPLMSQALKRPGPPHRGGSFGFNRSNKKKKPTPAEASKSLDLSKNPVQLLNELKKGLPYELSSQDGPVHQPYFTLKVEIDGVEYTGTDRSKKLAKLNCAKAALTGLGFDLTNIEAVPVAKSDSPVTAPSVTEEKKAQNLNPLLILNQIRPGIQYEEKGETGDKKNKIYTMTVTVGSETFLGTGSSKRMAKGNAAQNALQKMFNLEFSTPTGRDELAVFQGHESDFDMYKPGKLAKAYSETEGGKNPVQELNELYTGLEYNFEQNDDKTMTCAIEVENQRFEATGMNKKVVKVQVAVEAIQFLHENGRYAQRMSEIMSRRAQAKGKSGYNWKQSQLNYGSTTQERIQEKKFNSGGRGIMMTKNAVGYLNDLYKGLEYTLIGDEKSLGKSMFTYRLRLENKEFKGTGRSKKEAQHSTAEEAVKWLSESGKIIGDISSLLTRKVAFVKGEELHGDGPTVLGASLSQPEIQNVSVVGSTTNSHAAVRGSRGRGGGGGYRVGRGNSYSTSTYSNYTNWQKSSDTSSTIVTAPTVATSVAAAPAANTWNASTYGYGVSDTTSAYGYGTTTATDNTATAYSYGATAAPAAAPAATYGYTYATPDATAATYGTAWNQTAAPAAPVSTGVWGNTTNYNYTQQVQQPQVSYTPDNTYGTYNYTQYQ